MAFSYCADHNPTPPYNREPLKKGESCETCKRIKIEGKIAKKTISVLLAQGFELAVFDCEEITVPRCRDATKLYDAMFTTDDDRLFVYKPGEEGRFGWVWFVYGNSGWDVISDYTTNLEEALKPVNEYAEKCI